MPQLPLIFLTAASLFAIASGDTYVSPEKKAELVFVGAEFAKRCPGTVIIGQERAAKRRNAIATRFQVWDDKVVAVFPRFKPEVPVTAAKRPLKSFTSDPDWAPVPCWDLHQEGVCDLLQSAVDIFVDAEKQAWILDSGFDEGLNSTGTYCAPKVVMVDLATNKVKRQFDLAGLTCSSSRVQYLAVEQTDSGRTFVYVSDATNNAVLVWDVLQARGFRVNLPDEMLSGCGGDDTARDVLYLALAHHPDGSRMLAITYLSSCVMFTMRTEFLRRASDSGRVVSRGLKQDRLVLLGADGGPGVFFRYVGKPEIYRWDTRDAFAAEHFDKVYEGQPHRLATCVAADYLKKRMLVLESNFQCFANGCVGSGVSHTITPMHKKNKFLEY